MASFQAKIGQKMPGKSENKIIIPIIFKRTRIREFQKNSKKIQKIRKLYYGFFSNQNKFKKAEKKRK